jgi:hypothetical protein
MQSCRYVQSKSLRDDQAIYMRNKTKRYAIHAMQTMKGCLDTPISLASSYLMDLI